MVVVEEIVQKNLKIIWDAGGEALLCKRRIFLNVRNLDMSA